MEGHSEERKVADWRHRDGLLICLLIESEQGGGVSVLCDRILPLGFFHWRFYFARKEVFTLCVIVSQHVQLCSNEALMIGEEVNAVCLCVDVG